MQGRGIAVLRRLSVLVAVLLLTAAEAGAQAPATSPSGDAAAKAAQQAAYARRQDALKRRKEAEARLDQTLKTPPDTAPHWMKRASERSKAKEKAQ